MSRLILLLLIVAGYFDPALASAKKPRYTFLFIGDGMGVAQVQLTDYYLKSSQKPKKLLFTGLSHRGLMTTHSVDKVITDSAAASSALATGVKTFNGRIGVDIHNKPLTNIVEELKSKKIATGLIATTRITHATPAAFAAHNIDRDNENEIAADLVESGVDYMAGGGIRHFIPKSDVSGKSHRTDEFDLVKEATARGYRTFIGEDKTADFKNIKFEPENRVLALFNYSHLPYEVDRQFSGKKTPSLAELTKRGIDLLSQKANGFFLMVEGGRIDHAGHNNDVKSIIEETIAFDDAVREAYIFYQQHKNETLIIVTADHETGGLSLGKTGHDTFDFDAIKKVTASIEDNARGVYNGDWRLVEALLKKSFDLGKLNAEETRALIKSKRQIEEAFKSKDQAASDMILQKFIAKVLSDRVHVSWGSFDHTAVAVPIFAAGKGAEMIMAVRDNTDISKVIKASFGLQAPPISVIEPAWDAM